MLKWCALLGIVLLASRTFAGPVTFGGGNCTVTYYDSVASEDDIKAFALTFPGHGSVHYIGTANPAFPDFGNDRGDAGASWDVQDLGNGALFGVSLFHTNKGSQQHTGGGHVTFGLGFVADRPLHFIFKADPQNSASTHFDAMFAGITQEINTDALGNTSGTLLQDGAPVARTVEGTIPAGSHSLNLTLDVRNGRVDFGGGNGGATVTLFPQATAIPLPPGAWTGLLTLGVLSAMWPLRRRLLVG